MEKEDGIDQFELLEEKIDGLIHYLNALNKEKDSLLEKIKVQDQRIATFDKEVEQLKSSRNEARQRILTLLQKMENLDF
ncbi:cell division protein ZapB [Thermodesulfobacteriota bacterium]